MDRFRVILNTTLVWSALMFFPFDLFFYGKITAFILIMSIILSSERFKQIRIVSLSIKYSSRIIYPLLYFYWIIGMNIFFIYHSSRKYFLVSATLSLLLIIFKRKIINSRSLLLIYWLMIGLLVMLAHYDIGTFAYLALTALFLILHTFYKDFSSRLNPHILNLFFIVSVTVPVSAILSLGVLEHEYQRIERQRGVRALFAFGRDLNLEKFIGSQIRFVAEGCDGEWVYIGSQEFYRRKAPFLVAINRVTGEMMRSNDPVHTSYNAAFDCSRGLLYLGLAYDPMVFAFHLNDISLPSRIYVTRNKDTWKVFLDDKRDLLYIVDGKGHLEVLNTENLERLLYLPDWGESFRLLDDGRGALKYRDIIYTMEYDNIDRGFLIEPVLSTMGLQQGTGWHDLRKGSEDIFVYTSLLSNLTHLVELNTGEEIGNIRLKRMVRFHHVDKDRQLIYFGNFLSGDLYVVDIKKMGIVKRLYVGRRARWINPSRDKRRILVGSAAGAFEIYVEDIFEK